MLEPVADIAAIGENVAQPGIAEPDRPEQVGRVVAILNVGPVDRHVDEEAQRVGDDMALASYELPARVIAANPATVGGLEALILSFPKDGCR